MHAATPVTINRQLPGETWLDTGRRILMPELPLIAGPKVCSVCGDDPTCCPTCNGAGEVYVDAGRPSREVSPDECIVAKNCPTCRGDGHHVCLPHACYHCGKESQVFDPLMGMHLCNACHRSAQP